MCLACLVIHFSLLWNAAVLKGVLTNADSHTTSQGVERVHHPKSSLMPRVYHLKSSLMPHVPHQKGSLISDPSSSLLQATTFLTL